MKLKLLLSIGITIVILSSCKKKDDSGNYSSYIPSFSDKIYLRNTAQTDSSFTLNWTKLSSDCFSKYYVLRETGTDSNDISLYSNSIIAEISQQDLCSYTDKNMPYATSVKYQIAAPSCEGIIYSNIIMLKRNITIFNLSSVSNVLIDKDSNNLIILESLENQTKISIINYDQQLIKDTLILEFAINAACLGKYNNNNELYFANLYFPYNIYIYNYNTLTPIDAFSIYNKPLSIAAYNNKIFFSSSFGYSHSAFCHDRATKALIGESGPGYTDYNILVVPNTNTNLIGISDYYGIYKLKFNNNGQGIGYNHNNNDTSFDKRYFQMSPSGNYFVASSDGQIYNTSDLTEVTILNNNNFYSGFAFNNDGSKIYAFQNSTQIIDEFGLPSGTKTKSYTTHGYPNRIFVDDNKIISLSKIENYSSSYVVEKISIN